MRNHNLTHVLVIGALLGGGAACSKRQGTGAAVGGLSGATLGAGLGALAGGNKGAVVGAGVGAAAGAGAGALIGRYMDKQEKELKKDVKSAKIEREGDRLVVKFNSAILFDVNQASIKSEVHQDLNEFAQVLQKYPDTDLIIEGHTDSTGPKALNEELSRSRAHAVIDYLTGQGVARQRMLAKGYADEQPVATNASDEGRRLNRRVQVEIAANEELRRRDAAGGSTTPPAQVAEPAASKPPTAVATPAPKPTPDRQGLRSTAPERRRPASR